ncbi:SDR family NAD(P)-dependent oxidoreductase [Novosphingobium sp. Leaf2]|uniref:SDR family NAD(P)-dependent oxidoreductase n=1 Tax=Novosphingobium sp. Leaf2 TaxID=1735670 RepID=UPI0007018919|nr:glucose 1-dehydrogenase [Novosphingobium sp. Leaf2]KQM21981.1 2-deoxy-D-gluconate 3-dehydrogenase [Novosphingobium sp. Leaf2]
MKLDVTDKRVLITGASSGLGAHFAHVLAAGGARVAIAARRRDRLDTLARELTGTAAEVSVLELDVADPGSIARAMTELAEAWGGVDVVVNNAGVTQTRPAIDITADDFDAVLDVNLRGAFLVAREAARIMRRDGKGDGGAIINIASILGLRQAGHVTSYAISKAGVVQMTKQLALEWARFGIRVNALAPGYIETELNADFWGTDAGKALIARIPQRRLGRLDELDAPLLMLASDASRFMTGSIIVIDGGHAVSGL